MNHSIDRGITPSPVRATANYDPIASSDRLPVRRTFAAVAGALALTTGLSACDTEQPAPRIKTSPILSIGFSLDSIGQAAVCPDNNGPSDPCIAAFNGLPKPFTEQLTARGWSGRMIGEGGEPLADILIYQRAINNAITPDLLQSDGQSGDGWTQADAQLYERNSQNNGESCAVYVLPALAEARHEEDPSPTLHTTEPFKAAVDEARQSIQEIADKNNKKGTPTIVVDMKKVTDDPKYMQADGVHPKRNDPTSIQVLRVFWDGVSKCKELLLHPERK